MTIRQHKLWGLIGLSVLVEHCHKVFTCIHFELLARRRVDVIQIVILLLACLQDSPLYVRPTRPKTKGAQMKHPKMKNPSRIELHTLWDELKIAKDIHCERDFALILVVLVNVLEKSPMTESAICHIREIALVELHSELLQILLETLLLGHKKTIGCPLRILVRLEVSDVL